MKIATCKLLNYSFVVYVCKSITIVYSINILYNLITLLFNYLYNYCLSFVITISINSSQGNIWLYMFCIIFNFIS